MYCNCGNTISEKSHTVKTVKGATDWVRGASIDKDKLPFKVLQNECGSCGRIMWQVDDKNGNFVCKNG
jgi:hypothetical protein